MRALMLTLPLLVFAAAQAETCGMANECEGRLYYVHIPQQQLLGNSLFSKSGLPEVNAVVTLPGGARVDLVDAAILSTNPELLREALRRATAQNHGLLEFGDQLYGGSRLRILGYQTFPALRDLANELFVLALVLPSAPN